MPPPNPHQVTLSAIALYGDYDENAKIGPAPAGLTCTLSGQSPDRAWAYLTCPAPTNEVWAKASDLELTAAQRDTLLEARIVSRAVPTQRPYFPPPATGATAGQPSFCADRDSVWGRTHQCAANQAAADALADGEMGKINATAEALHEAMQHKP